MQVSLTNRARLLAPVAAALGAAGVNINRLECRRVEGLGGRLSFLLDLPDSCVRQTLVAVCEQIEGVTVDCIAAYPAAGSLRYDLIAVEQMVREPLQAPKILATAAVLVFRAQWSLLLRVGDGATRVIFSTPLAPDLDGATLAGVDSLDRRRGAAVGIHCRLGGNAELAVAPVGAETLLVGRRDGPPFSHADLTRLEHLTNLAAQLESRTEPPNDLAHADQPAPTSDHRYLQLARSGQRDGRQG
jgi:hypothetical protein